MLTAAQRTTEGAACRTWTGSAFAVEQYCFRASITNGIFVGTRPGRPHWEAIMARLITRGRFTHDYVKGLLAAPEDREPVVRKLIEGAGGKMVNFYFTTGESDFLLVSEADEPEFIIAALLAAAAAGTISDLSTSRAWTGKEFKGIADKASKVAKAYRVPGKH